MRKTQTFFRTLLLLALLWSGISIQAQSLEEQLLEALSTLDENAITTGILYDRCPEYQPLKHLDGIQSLDTSLYGIDDYKLMYGMMHYAHLDTPTDMPAIEEYYTLIDDLGDQEVISFTGLYYTYDKLREDALDNGLVSWQGKHLYDVSSSSDCPYFIESRYVIRTTQYELLGKEHVFQFDKDLLSL